MATMPLYGYGEDALTSRLPEFLRKLDDDSDPRAAVVIYRPSFGRSGKASPFGEFDGIVGTARGIYLIEAKWCRSSEAWQPTMSLRSEQLRRHAIFRWYLESWRAQKPIDWLTFIGGDASESFAARFEGKGLAPPNSILARSIEHTIALLADCGPIVEDVLLYCDIDNRLCPPQAAGFAFRTVSITFTNAHSSGIFPMTVPVEFLPQAG